MCVCACHDDVSTKKKHFALIELIICLILESLNFIKKNHNRMWLCWMDCIIDSYMRLIFVCDKSVWQQRNRDRERWRCARTVSLQCFHNYTYSHSEMCCSVRNYQYTLALNWIGQENNNIKYLHRKKYIIDVFFSSVAINIVVSRFILATVGHKRKKREVRRSIWLTIVHVHTETERGTHTPNEHVSHMVFFLFDFWWTVSHFTNADNDNRVIKSVLCGLTGFSSIHFVNMMNKDYWNNFAFEHNTNDCHRSSSSSSSWGFYQSWSYVVYCIVNFYWKPFDAWLAFFPVRFNMLIFLVLHPIIHQLIYAIVPKIFKWHAHCSWR